MTSYTQDKNFISSVISNNLLQDAIDWIITNLNPEDVFDEKVLKEWARDNGFIKEN